MDAMDKKDMTVESDAVLNKEAEQNVMPNNKAEQEVVSRQEDEQETTPEIILQYRGYEVDVEAMTERVKAHYYSKGYKKGSIKTLQIYAKPEDFTAYYVINDGVVGKVNLFYD